MKRRVFQKQESMVEWFENSNQPQDEPSGFPEGASAINCWLPACRGPRKPGMASEAY
jgi:hypothetical protein